MDLKLSGKKALVTGSTAGIGLAIAKGLAGEGSSVVINGRTQARVDKAIKIIMSDYPDARVSGFACDFSKVEDINNLLLQLEEVDILINNVGIFEPSAFEKIMDEDWYRLFDIKVMSGIRLSRQYFPKMVKNNWGRIIFISSESGIQIPAEMIHYGMTKTAQIAVAGGLARLTRGTNVTVNTVIPGSTKSEGAAKFISDLAREKGMSQDEVEEDFFENMRPTSLIKRFATPEEVANMVVYLCSPLAAATNGAAIRVDGGTVPTIL